jgi:hypothetical protein
MKYCIAGNRQITAICKCGIVLKLISSPKMFNPSERHLFLHRDKCNKAE